MIKNISFKKTLKQGNLSYVSSLPAIEALNGHIEFKDGLNVIVGPNGSGKSSILNCISHIMAANITGFSSVSKSWLKGCDFESFLEDNALPITPAIIEHDGRPIMYCNPRQGISSIARSLDESEFQIETILDSFGGTRESSGEKSNRLLTPLTNSIPHAENIPETISAIFNINDLNDHWLTRLKTLQLTWLKPSIPLGKPTIILDEPETGLSILNQILLWNKVLRNKDVLKDFQIILVSHSIECLNIPGAHYIELKKGFLDTCRQAMAGKIDEKTMAQQASNIIKPLNKRQRDVLLNIEQSHSDVIFKDNKTQRMLLDLDFIDTYKQSKKESDDTRDRWEKRLNPTYVCHITHKGSQYLKLHS